MKIILLGAPGSGKGTIAELISNDFGLPHISTGVLLREEIAKGTETGKIAKKLLDKGNLFPDDLMIEIVKERIQQKDCKNGFVFDGFPRTLFQAQQLAKITKIDYVFLLKITEKEIVARLTNRVVCSKCKAVYNKNNYTKNTCEKCGGELIIRDDDTLEVIKKRIEVYKAESAPIIQFYQNQIIEVEFAKTPSQFYAPVRAFLKKEVEKHGSK